VKIHTVWATRKGSEDVPELLTAWDEYCKEEFPEGFKKDWESALAVLGSDLHAFRHIDIEVDFEAVARVFETPVVPGAID
jgi:hypothetical protein